MSRTIRFRAWDTQQKKMFHQLTLGNYADFFKTSGCSAFLEIMQFTGLRDRNGTEIYEGDVLRDDTGDLFEVKFGKLPLDKSGDCVCTFEAFYAEGYGQLGRAPNHKCNQIGDWMEILGNVWEHPDLLHKAG